MENPCLLPHKVFIGTHHKTGTAWLLSVFEEICRKFSLSLSVCSKKKVANPLCNIVFNYHSAFDPYSLTTVFRGAHLIRDPRDIIISGCFYHLKSTEHWLHKPMDKLQGKTYHDKINGLNTIDDQLMFEMENIGQITINDILQWNYSNSFFFELKYETLINDRDLIIFRDLFSFLGFHEGIIPDLLTIVNQNSIFSAPDVNKGHVHSGEINQWKEYFKPIHKQRFIELFDDALIRLGYELDNNWAYQEFDNGNNKKNLQNQ